MKRLALSCMMAAALAGCATVENPVTGRMERTVMDERAELEQGRLGHEQVLAEYAVLADPALQSYVENLGQRLAAQSHRGGLDWNFTVLDSPEVNAFALPGGYVYVTRGLMAYMESQADLAGVLAHEIGHVTARHGAQRATRQQTAGLGVLAAGVLGAVLEGQGVKGAGDLAAQVSQNVAAGYIASYSRSQELQADHLAAEYLSRVQLDPRNMIDVIQVLKDQEQYAADMARAQGREPSQRGHWLASHPSNEQRLEEIAQKARAYQGRFQEEGRAPYLRAIDGLAFGESEAQGWTRGRQFFHRPLGFALTAPPAWHIRNSADSVAVVSPREDAALLLAPAPATSGSGHAEVLRAVVGTGAQGRMEQLQINGLPATRFVGVRPGPRGSGTVPVDVTVVTGPKDKRYVFVAAARTAASMAQAAAGLREAMMSFRPMTPADRAAARPWTLRTVPFPAGGFSELARRSPLGSDAERQLRLLNGVYAASRAPRPGDLVKTVTED